MEVMEDCMIGNMLIDFGTVAPALIRSVKVLDV